MRWFLNGVLMAGMLMILWGVFEARQAGDANAPSQQISGEDGTPLPQPDPPSSAQ